MHKTHETCLPPIRCQKRSHASESISRHKQSLPGFSSTCGTRISSPANQWTFPHRKVSQLFRCWTMCQHHLLHPNGSPLPCSAANTLFTGVPFETHSAKLLNNPSGSLAICFYLSPTPRLLLFIVPASKFVRFLTVLPREAEPDILTESRLITWMTFQAPHNHLRQQKSFPY